MYRDTASPQIHLCSEPKRISWKSALVNGIMYAVGSPPSVRQWYGSSGTSSAGPSAGVRISSTNVSTTEGDQSPLEIRPDDQHKLQTSIHMPGTEQLVILFGVKGARLTLELAQINTLRYDQDHIFFHHLREQHKDLRGWLRHWFSFWRLSHCDYVKVR